MVRRWAPLAAALSVVAIVVAVALVVGRSPSGQPPVLRLASGAASHSGVAADAPLAAGSKAGASGSFELVRPLPSAPDEARAHPLPRGAADADDVRRLATALGIPDAPKRVEGGWQAGILRVRDDAGNPWFMYAGMVCGPDVPVSSSDGGTAISCASGGVGVGSSGSVGPGTSSSGSGSSGSGSAPNATTVAPAPPVEPAPAISPCPANARCAKPPVGTLPPPLPSPGPTIDTGAARAAASAVLKELGLGDADVSVQGGGEHAFVQAAPRVDGLRTSGYDTSLEIDADGKVFSGNGYLGRPGDGAMYPLISAKAAYDALPELPRPMFLCPANADCPQPMPQKITGAELGLMLTPLADNAAALLPAWLFTVEGWTAPMAQAAIEPRFLQLPKPVVIDPGQPVPPAEPPQPAPSASRASFGFDAVFPTDDPNAVIVQYGDSGSCPHTNVTHLVKETADSVVVFLEGDAMPTKQVCTDDYRQQLVTVKLDSPLGNRNVVDGSRSEAVAVDRSCARPMGQPSPPKSCS